MKFITPPPFMPSNCAVREHTGDGVSVGRCWHFVRDGRCPRHGDVRHVQDEYARTGRMTNDYDLAGRAALEAEKLRADRMRASLDWALEEHAGTLERLAGIEAEKKQ